MSRTPKVKMTHRSHLCTLAPGLPGVGIQSPTPKVGGGGAAFREGTASQSALVPWLQSRALGSRGSRPLGKAVRATWRGGGGRAENETGRGAWTLVPRVGERGGHPGRGSPGDWQRLRARRAGRRWSQLVHVRNSGWGRASPSLHTPPLPSPPSSSSGSGCSSSGQPLTFPEQGKQPRGGQGPQQGAGHGPQPRGSPAFAGGSRRAVAPRTRAVSPAGGALGPAAGRAARRGGRKRSEEGAPPRRVNRAKVSGAALKGAVPLPPCGERLEGNTRATRGDRRSRGVWACVPGGWYPEF